MKKLFMALMMAIAVMIPTSTQASTSPTRLSEATYKGNSRFTTDDGNVWKYSHKGLVKGARYVIKFNTKGTSKVKDDKILKVTLTPSMKAVKKYGTKSAMKKCADKEKSIKSWIKIHAQTDNVKFIKEGCTSYEYIDNRKDSSTIYVTWEDGKCLNSYGDGKSFYYTKPFNYIGYRGVKGAKKGTIIRSYFIWCNCCNEPDDIVRRFDVIIKK